MAPVGTMILAPVARALSTRYIRGRRAPTEDGMNIRPDSIAAVAISSNADAGAASTYVRSDGVERAAGSAECRGVAV